MGSRFVVDVRVRLQVHQYVSQTGKLPEQSILHFVANPVSRGDSEVLIHFNVNVGEELQSRLADLQRLHVPHILHLFRRRSYLLHQFGVRLHIHQVAGAGAKQLHPRPDDRPHHHQ